MRVQHNILAMNSYRNYSNNVSALGKNLEKLSSGYKINRAGDDAAGLAISEKMRAQIKGLEAAQKNVKDATSFVKTAEGAMQEIQDMLGRMKYLATQSANGTYDSLVDRDNIQLEVDALLKEIDRIADSANFNGIEMLHGGTASSASPAKFDPSTGTQVTGVTVSVDGAKATGDIKVQITKPTSSPTSGTKASGTVAATVAGMKGWKFEGAESDALNDKSITVKIGAAAVTTSSCAVSGGNMTITLAGDDLTKYNSTTNLKTAINNLLKNSGDEDWAKVTLTDAGATGSFIAGSIAASTTLFAGTALKDGAAGNPGGSYTVKLTSGKGTDTVNITSASWTGSVTVAGTNSGVTATLTAASITADVAETKLGSMEGGGNKYEITMQIGDSAGEQLKIEIGSMKTDAIGISGLMGSGVKTAGDANTAIGTIKNAINYVSSVRGQLGAYQNRLEHTAKNLSVMTENIQDAESSIRDTDVADEMMSYVKNNILVQSAQAMLAQANQVPQGVLQLLG